MNLDLKISKKYRNNLKYKQPLRTGLLSDDGIRYRFEFDNYGVSVIKSEFTYGGEYDLWEVAIVDIGKNNIIYNKELSRYDVLGYLTDEDVNKFLYCVKNCILDKPFEEIKDTINIESEE